MYTRCTRVHPDTRRPWSARCAPSATRREEAGRAREGKRAQWCGQTRRRKECPYLASMALNSPRPANANGATRSKIDATSSSSRDSPRWRRRRTTCRSRSAASRLPRLSLPTPPCRFLLPRVRRGASFPSPPITGTRSLAACDSSLSRGATGTASAPTSGLCIEAGVRLRSLTRSGSARLATSSDGPRRRADLTCTSISRTRRVANSRTCEACSHTPTICTAASRAPRTQRKKT